LALHRAHIVGLTNGMLGMIVTVSFGGYSVKLVATRKMSTTTKEE